MNTIEKTLFVGKKWLHFEELASTNSYATEYLSTTKPLDGTVISTYKQAQGRGQGGSFWESEPDKNIAMSLIVQPHFLAARDQFVLSQAVSLGVLDFIQKYVDGDAKVKWPNDIYIGNKKVAGILIQNTLSSSKIQNSIIGVGINVNQTKFKSEAPNPTSLKLETGKDFDLDELLEMLCWKIEVRYLQLKANAFDKIKTDYLENLYRYATDAMFQIPAGDFFQGRIIGIGEFGKLLLQTKRGVEEFDTKEVKFVVP